MSTTSFRVQLDESGTSAADVPDFTRLSRPNRRLRRVFVTVAITAISVLAVVGLAGFIYYQTLKKTPQYSLALLVDSAKRDDKASIDQLVDINSVVDDFLPQITGKAVEMYGRGLPQPVIARMTQIAQPLMPAVKDRARAELPKVIRSRTEQFGYVPFFAMVLGADRYLDIQVQGDTAIVKSRQQERKMEVTMRRSGDRWQIVGVREEQLATDIARTIGQQIIAVATNGVNKNTAETLGVGNLADLLRQAGELVR